MSNATSPNPEVQILENIQEDGRVQAQRIVDDAQRVANAEEQRARSDATKAQEAILTKAREKGDRIRAVDTATGRIEARRILLKAREESVSGVFTEIKQGLATLRKNAERYRRSLVVLAAEAVVAVGGQEVTLRVAQKDKACADSSAFVEDVRREAAQHVAAVPNIHLAWAEKDTGGGCIVVDPSERVVFDNTYPRRLARMRRQLRMTIIRELAKHDA